MDRLSYTGATSSQHKSCKKVASEKLALTSGILYGAAGCTFDDVFVSWNIEKRAAIWAKEQ